MKKIRSAIVGLGRIGSTLEDDRLREKPILPRPTIAERIFFIENHSDMF